MKTENARLKLEKNGYKVVISMQGGYIATKGQRTFKSDTINGLIQQIFN